MKDKIIKSNSIFSISINPMIGILTILMIMISIQNISLCKSLECQFLDYLKANNIKFISPLEKEYRFKIFKQNLQEIKTFNDSHPNIKLDLNNFGILTKNEFKKSMTNPDFLFTDDKAKKHHINVNDPRNEEVIDSEIIKENEETLKAIKKEVRGNYKTNPLVLLEWDIEDADKAVKKELKNIHNFLREHESNMNNDSEILDKDGGNF